jgi:hypothetical protein
MAQFDGLWLLDNFSIAFLEIKSFPALQNILYDKITCFL